MKKLLIILIVLVSNAYSQNVSTYDGTDAIEWEATDPDINIYGCTCYEYGGVYNVDSTTWTCNHKHVAHPVGNGYFNQTDTWIDMGPGQPAKRKRTKQVFYLDSLTINRKVY